MTQSCGSAGEALALHPQRTLSHAPAAPSACPATATQLGNF